MATGTLTPTPYQSVFDDNGDPVSGALIYTYLAGTTTLAATYADVSLATANSNPLVADSAGRFVAFLTPGASYKFVYQTAAAVAIRTVDNVSAVPTSSSNLDITGVAGEALGAGVVAYLSDGSGSKAAGQWFKADNTNPYSSTLPEIATTIAAITSGSSGTFRLGGQGTGFTSLTVGTDYYIGTAGALTSSAPANNRRLIGRADSTSTIIFPNPSVPPIDVSVCQGRLTLTTAVPVTSADVTAATTLYFTPYKGNRVALYDGSNWSMRTFAELSIAVPATTSQLYDVWLYDNAGTLALELLAWTNDTTRATALVAQDGIQSKTGALTRRYLGSCRTTTVSGQTEDSAAKRYVWNYTHRQRRILRALEATASWTYTTAVFRQANGAATNQVDVIVGVADAMLEALLSVSSSNSSANIERNVGIGEDSTTTPLGSQVHVGTYNGVVLASTGFTHVTTLRHMPAVGRHYYAWLEKSTATGTTTWFGATSSGTINDQGGMVGTIDG